MNIFEEPPNNELRFLRIGLKKLSISEVSLLAVLEFNVLSCVGLREFLVTGVGEAINFPGKKNSSCDISCARALFVGETRLLSSCEGVLKLVLANRAFVTLVILYGIMTLAIALITAGLPFAAMYLIMDDGNSLLSGVAKGLGTLSLMFAAFVIGSIISQALWVKLSNLYGKVAAQLIGILCYIALLIFIFFSLPNYNVTLIAGLFILAGMTNGSYQQIPWALYPDLMDVTREKSGESIEGAFSAVWLFGQKVANAVSPLMLGFILSLYGWKETTEGITKQTDAALNTLQTSITLIPAAILGLAGILLFSIYLPQHKRLMSGQS